jgi:DNA-binding MarR family transcriptional regulator
MIDQPTSGAALLEQVLELSQHMRVVLDSEGLTVRRYRALRELSQGPLRMGELAARIEIRTPSTVTLVQKLEDEGLAGRSSDPGDNRATVVALTPAGAERLRIAGERLVAEFEQLAAAER